MSMEVLPGHVIYSLRESCNHPYIIIMNYLLVVLLAICCKTPYYLLFVILLVTLVVLLRDVAQGTQCLLALTLLLLALLALHLW